MQALMIAGGVLSAVSSISSGIGAARAGEANARRLREQSAATNRATVERENLTRQRSAADLAKQRAALLAGGVDPTRGTALIGVGQSMQDAEMDALTLRYEGLMQSREQTIAADQSRWEGRARKRQGFLSAAGSLMQAGGSYLRGTQAPAPVESRTPTPSPFYPRGML